MSSLQVILVLKSCCENAYHSLRSVLEELCLAPCETKSDFHRIGGHSHTVSRARQEWGFPFNHKEGYSSKNRYFIQMGIAEIDLCGLTRFIPLFLASHGHKQILLLPSRERLNQWSKRARKSLLTWDRCIFPMTWEWLTHKRMSLASY